MLYTLWDMETNNLVAEYESRQQALMLVIEGIKRNGPRDTDPLVLELENDEGEVTTIASGAGLAELARRELPPERIAG